MAVEKARRERRRYTWSYDQKAGHFEVLDAGPGCDQLCDVIATTRCDELRDRLINSLEGDDYQPARWL
jgi:hypothetical protein